MTGTERITKDPMYYTVDGHFNDKLIHDIPGKLREDREDSTISDETISTEEIERDKRRMRRNNQKYLIEEIRRLREEVELMRKDLKPYLIVSAIAKYLWSHLILTALTTVALGALVAWLTGLIGG